MRTLTLLFYAAATFFLGILAAPWAAAFGQRAIPGQGPVFEALEMGLTIVFVAFAVLNVWAPPGDDRAAGAQAVGRRDLSDLLGEDLFGPRTRR